MKAWKAALARQTKRVDALTLLDLFWWLRK